MTPPISWLPGESFRPRLKWLPGLYFRLYYTVLVMSDCDLTLTLTLLEGGSHFGLGWNDSPGAKLRGIHFGLAHRDSGIPNKLNPRIPENREKFPGFPKIGNFPVFPGNRDSRSKWWVLFCVIEGVSTVNDHITFYFVIKVQFDCICTINSDSLVIMP